MDDQKMYEINGTNFIITCDHSNNEMTIRWYNGIITCDLGEYENFEGNMCTFIEYKVYGEESY